MSETTWMDNLTYGINISYLIKPRPLVFACSMQQYVLHYAYHARQLTYYIIYMHTKGHQQILPPISRKFLHYTINILKCQILQCHAIILLRYAMWTVYVKVYKRIYHTQDLPSMSMCTDLKKHGDFDSHRDYCTVFCWYAPHICTDFSWAEEYTASHHLWRWN